MYLDDTHRRHVRNHLLKRVSLWLLFIGAVLVLGVKSELDRLHDAFVAEADNVTRHSTRTLKTFDVALDGFRQFLSLLPDANLEAARNYAATLRSHYPELRLFAIAQSVGGSGEIAATRWLNRISYRGLRLVAVTGAESDEQDSAGHYYLPLVFTEPAVQANRELVEIDRAFNRTFASVQGTPGRHISDLFEFGDHGSAYLMFAPVRWPSGQAVGHEQSWLKSYALLLIRVEDLVPSTFMQGDGWSLRLLIDSPQQPQRLLWQFGQNGQRMIDALVSPFTIQRTLDRSTQPFTLAFNYRPQWRDLDHQFLGLLIALVLALVFVAKRLVSFSHRRSIGDFQERSSLYQQANYDHLTGLPNANLMMDRLERGMQTLDPQKEALVLAYLDLDNFKPVNDRWGHDAGDRILVEVARRLRQQFRMQDTVSRIHGDEFIVLLMLPREALDTAGVTAKIEQVFSVPFEEQGNQLAITASVGVAVYDRDAVDAESLISAADKCMYRDKGSRETNAEPSPLPA